MSILKNLDPGDPSWLLWLLIIALAAWLVLPQWEAGMAYILTILETS